MDVHARVQDLIREVFDDERLVVSETTTAEDVPGWDSVMHVNLMFAVEERFGIRFRDDELGGFANVGELVRVVESKIGGP